MFYIKKGGLYVNAPGSSCSYTNRKENAQTFNTKEEAERNACGNEYVSTN
jgi:hypothetical protein